MCLEGEMDRLREDNRRLRSAIRKHRRDVWGDLEVDHDVDSELYEALGELEE
jgi:hypothetical protein